MRKIRCPIILMSLLSTLSLVSSDKAAAQSDPVADYIANYYEMLNNYGDAKGSLADRRLFREEILSRYFLYEGSLIWNHLRPEGKRYITPREYLDNILTDFPEGIAFRYEVANVSNLEPANDGLKTIVRLKLTAKPAGQPSVSHDLRMVLAVRQYNPTSLSARIKSIDKAGTIENSAVNLNPVTPLVSGERPASASVSLPEPIRELELNMVRIAGGSFMMGCNSEGENSCYDDEKPLHQITLSGFSISKYEVTQGQWEAVMGTSVADQRDKVNTRYPLRGEGPQYPMYYVSWEEVQEFIQKLNRVTGGNYRLPTEAEWEYAAAGGSMAQDHLYAGGHTLKAVGWFDENSEGATAPVGLKSPNELGLYDMSGNVWEWCSDWYSADYYSHCPAENPPGERNGKYRVRRGGSWNDSARSCRVTSRRSSKPDMRYGNLGFRLVAP